MQRTTPLFSLFFFLAAVGHWLGMKNRSFAVAAILTTAIYAITAVAPTRLGYEDFFVVALVSSLLVFALAGFNMVFVLEEIVYDIQRLNPLRLSVWRFAPTFLVLTLAWLLPLLPRIGLPWLRATWIAALILLVIMGGWWFLRAFNPIREGPVLKELHLLLFGSLLMTGLIDSIQLLADQTGILPSLVAYVVLVGTWMYVSYTTLQRTHFLLGGRNAIPWLLILLSASFALVQHAFLHYRVDSTVGINVLLNQRLAYIVVGVAIGMAVYIAEAAWRIFRRLRDDGRLTPRGRILAGRFARLAENLFNAEKRVLQGSAYQIYAGVDSLLPGPKGFRVHPGWELDHEKGTVRRLDAEE